AASARRELHVATGAVSSTHAVAFSKSRLVGVVDRTFVAISVSRSDDMKILRWIQEKRHQRRAVASTARHWCGASRPIVRAAPRSERHFPSVGKVLRTIDASKAS